MKFVTLLIAFMASMVLALPIEPPAGRTICLLVEGACALTMLDLIDRDIGPSGSWGGPDYK